MMHSGLRLVDLYLVLSQLSDIQNSALIKGAVSDF